jgi:hypothetical protein
MALNFNTVFGAPVAAPIRAPYPFVGTQYFQSFMAINGFEDNLNGHYAFWITYTMAQQPTFPMRTGMIPLPAATQAVANPQANNDTGVGVPFARQADAVYTVGAHGYRNLQEVQTALTGGVMTQEEYLQASAFFNHREPLTGMFKLLICCHQVKELKAENINNFFRQMSTSGIQARTVLTILNTTSHVFANLAENMAVEIAANKFLQYHTTYCSAPNLLYRMDGDLGQFNVNVFSVADRNAIRAAYQAPYDKALAAAIPQACIVSCAAWMEANNAFPEGWFQGIRAKEEAGAGKYNAILKEMKHLSLSIYGSKRALKYRETEAILDNASRAVRRGAAIDPATVTTALTRVRTKQAEMDQDKMTLENARLTALNQPVLTVLPAHLRTTLEQAYEALDNE